ncbi:MAG: hypothetical protein K8F52_14440 [Candidatus Scalindua rubra]|uniref:Uncharacterized protein n=1 Tax=Candidatus Scalindua brodae TaxID=237368 RepID=A0A0B0EQ42_9BACT|nr:MAG: hypothetical protein SCABRO_00264 [Candidatus Scalindua brodae]MBZ0109848.1 hypothetical protein [Candidatus Scalindua rubra]TWU33075.1 hypothetical protein S225a_15250 [Candidatus Brocadiaceae bacterium S225]
MEAIKRIVRTPKNHEIRIKIPAHIPENDPVEIIIFFSKKTEDYNNKMNELKNATRDKLFLGDLREVSEDLKHVDLEEWQ